MRGNSLAGRALLAGAADLALAAPKAACNADNCLRALRATDIPGRLQDAQSFCAQYTAATASADVPVPTYASEGCKQNQNGDTAARLASACACIASAATSAPTSSSVTVSATIAASNTVVSSSTAPTASGNPTGEPCAAISSSWAAQKAANTAATPMVPADLALECLKTVPLGKNEGIQLVDALLPYLEWQSDAEYKKNPPKPYFYRGFDIFGNLAQVKSKLQAEKYESEWDFQSDLYNTVFAPGQDGHYAFYPDILARSLKFRHNVALVSVSEDGKILPEIKLHDDLVADPNTARAIKKINGIDAAKYVEDIGNMASSYQDVDTTYNSLFYSKAVEAAGGRGSFFAGGRQTFMYQGSNITLTFADGTSTTSENKATVIGDWGGVVDGPSYYKAFCTPKTPEKDKQTFRSNSRVPGYPTPVIATKDGLASGYFLKGDGLEDVAVLALLSFHPKSSAEFQTVISDFLREAKAAGKNKLVVDLQNNGGGSILLGYDFFRQLFPQIVPDGYSRWKETEGYMIIARAISAISDSVDPATASDETLISLYQTWFNYRHDLNITDQPFQSFMDKFSPQVFQNTQYTNIMRWNLTDPLTTTNETFGSGIAISGYGSRANLTQPFAAEDIILLYDGQCSSTCTLASEMLRIQAGVKSVAFGGRPKEGPIQGVGGVKGAQVLEYRNIKAYAAVAKALTKSVDDTDSVSELDRYTDLPMQRSTAGVVNVRDQILRDNVNDGVPAQFISEEADCRMYWTAPMISDVTEIWKAAANAAFNGAKCAHGGISGSSPKRRETSATISNIPAQRLSELVDTASADHSEFWEALHIQQMVSVVA